jgi:hypothetical protein
LDFDGWPCPDNTSSDARKVHHGTLGVGLLSASCFQHPPLPCLTIGVLPPSPSRGFSNQASWRFGAGRAFEWRMASKAAEEATAGGRVQGRRGGDTLMQRSATQLGVMHGVMHSREPVSCDDTRMLPRGTCTQARWAYTRTTTT